MASNIVRPPAATLLPQAPQCDTTGEQGRLGFIRTVKHFCWTALDQLPQIITKGAGGLLECLPDHGFVAQVRQHGYCLRSLTGKNKSTLTHYFLLLYFFPLHLLLLQ